LYWLGRSAERVDALARTIRVITSRRQQDPTLVSADDGRWSLRMVAMLRAVREAESDPDTAFGASADPAPIADQRPAVQLQRELQAAVAALGRELDAAVTGAASVGEYLSGTASRVLNRLAGSRQSFAHGRAPIDTLDDLLEQLAAFAGLWVESIVRGPAWWLGDFGRRLERAGVVLRLVGAATDELDAASSADAVDSAVLDVLLAANESLVAYRRHHRSDVELPLVNELLLADANNPRSLAACVVKLGDHAAAMRWEAGMRAVGELGDTVTMADLDALADLVHESWFATPVKPVVVHGEVDE
jgi:uncharacterized alpha-E superfamily protein